MYSFRRERTPIRESFGPAETKKPNPGENGMCQDWRRKCDKSCHSLERAETWVLGFCVPERSSSKEAFFLLSEEELEALALLDSN